AQAEDRKPTAALGVSRAVVFVANKIADKLAGLVSLPMKVMLRSADARVTIGENASVEVDDVVGIYATASADASGTVKSQTFSIGYGQADATAVIDVGRGSTITGGGAINITSAASATAKTTTETNRQKQEEVPGKNTIPFAASLAVSNVTLTSTTT